MPWGAHTPAGCVHHLAPLPPGPLLALVRGACAISGRQMCACVGACVWGWSCECRDGAVKAPRQPSCPLPPGSSRLHAPPPSKPHHLPPACTRSNVVGCKGLCQLPSGFPGVHNSSRVWAMVLQFVEVGVRSWVGVGSWNFAMGWARYQNTRAWNGSVTSTPLPFCFIWRDRLSESASQWVGHGGERGGGHVGAGDGALRWAGVRGVYSSLTGGNRLLTAFVFSNQVPRSASRGGEARRKSKTR
jgi:hypothetical protein